MYTLADLVRLKQRTASGEVIPVTTRDTVREAVRLMIEHDFSQLPVVNAATGTVEGAISTESIVRLLYHLSDPAAQAGTLFDIMELNVA